MQGCSSPEQLCARSAKLGYQGIALTDFHSLAGLWSFLAACKKHILRPVIGVELTNSTDSLHVICLAKNLIGYGNICDLVSSRLSSENFSLEREIITKRDGIIVLSDSLVFLDTMYKSCVDIAANLGDQPTEHGGRLRKWAQKKSIPAVVVPTVVMAKSKDASLLQLMGAIRTNERLDAHIKDTESAVWMHSPKVYQERFAVWPEVMNATDVLARRCKFQGPDFGLVMPPWENHILGGAKRALRDAAYSGACHRYGMDLSEAVVEYY